MRSCACGRNRTYDEGERLLAANSHVAGDLLVTADTEGTHGVTGLGEHGLLASELLQHLRTQIMVVQNSNKTSKTPPCMERDTATERIVRHELHRSRFWTTLAALVSLSPLSPTEMLRMSLCTLKFFMHSDCTGKKQYPHKVRTKPRKAQGAVAAKTLTLATS